MDEIRDRTGLEPTPLTWPVGIAGDFRGVLERSTGDFLRFTRTAGGATLAPEERVEPARAAADEGEAWSTAVEEAELLDAMGQVHDQQAFLAGRTTPVLFGSAVLNFGVRQLLDVLLSPRASAGPARGRRRSPPAAGRAVQRVRVQGAGRHGHPAPRPAGVRAGLLRGVRARHGRHALRHRQAVRDQVRPAGVRPGPGDRRRRLPGRRGRPGQRHLAAGRRHPVRRGAGAPTRRSRASRPSTSRSAAAEDSGRYKQFRRGIEQLEQEGVVQVLRSDRRGDQAPVLAAVGPMQFEVAVAPAGRGVQRAGPARPAALLDGPARRTPRPPERSPGSRGWRCCSAATGRCSRSSPTSGGCRACSATCRTPCSSRWSPPPAEHGRRAGLSRPRGSAPTRCR